MGNVAVVTNTQTAVMLTKVQFILADIVEAVNYIRGSAVDYRKE
jgi:hypothetical protein